MIMSTNNLLSPIGLNKSHCGYCNLDQPTSHTYGIWAHSLNPLHYRALMDIGWRRSGLYLYKPQMASTCCPQYPIRLNVHKFKPSKQHRKLISKASQFLNVPVNTNLSGTPACFDYVTSISHLLTVNGNSHTLKTRLEEASATQPKFNLFNKYQITVHGDSPCKNTIKSFTRFLVDSPLTAYNKKNDPPVITRNTSKIANGTLEQCASLYQYGTYHLNYYLDNILIAVSVLDIVPGCVSSVYFFYDPEYKSLYLGKFSAMVEMALAQEESLRNIATNDQYTDSFLYLGYYIHGCQKMEYKGQFYGSELLDPISLTWVSLDDKTRTRLVKSDQGFTQLTDSNTIRTRANTPDDLLDRTIDQTEFDVLQVLVNQSEVIPMSQLQLLAEDNHDLQEIIMHLKQCALKLDSQTACQSVFDLSCL